MKAQGQNKLPRSVGDFDAGIQWAKYDTRNHLYCLIKLGLWDNARIIASQFVKEFDVLKTEDGEVLVRWHDRYFENSIGEKHYYPLDVFWRA